MPKGGNTFTVVTGGIESALAQARRAAGGQDVALSRAGPRPVSSISKASLVDEMEINLVPIRLGDGERLFDGVGVDLHGLELLRTIAAPNVTHLKFVRRS